MKHGSLHIPQSSNGNPNFEHTKVAMTMKDADMSMCNSTTRRGADQLVWPNGRLTERSSPRKSIFGVPPARHATGAILSQRVELEVLKPSCWHGDLPFLLGYLAVVQHDKFRLNFGLACQVAKSEKDKVLPLETR